MYTVKFYHSNPSHNYEVTFETESEARECMASNENDAKLFNAAGDVIAFSELNGDEIVITDMGK